MRVLGVGEVRRGLKVVWLGPEAGDDILSPDKVEGGGVLVHHHPGVLTSVQPLSHLQVDWLGLEDEPVSFAVGFSPDEAGTYPALGVVSDERWANLAVSGWWSQSRDSAGTSTVDHSSGERPAQGGGETAVER